MAAHRGKDPSFGRPDVFGTHIPETKWESATITTLDARIPKYIEKIAKRDPFSGKVVTGGIVTVKDSSWLLSWTVNRQPHFKKQPKDQVVIWLYGLFATCRGITSRSRCRTAPARKSPRNGCITWVCRLRTSRSLQPREPTPCR
nr:oleate hydratase [Brevundimonas vancanneytii]